MTTLQLSMELDLEDEQPSSRRVSPANPTALRENVRRLVMSAIFGQKSLVLWGKLNRHGSWEKTSQDCLALNLETSSVKSSMTWPAWGTAYLGECFELPMLELYTEGLGCSSLGTPRASDAMSKKMRDPDAIGNPKGRLEDQIALEPLPTPTGQCAKGGTSGMSKDGSHSLNSYMVTLNPLPTPSAFDSKDFVKANPLDKTTKRGKSGGRSNLREKFPGLLPTPAASQGHKPTRPLAPSEANGTHGTMLVGALGEATGERGVLNPLFVEMMMGLPVNYTLPD